MVTVMRPSRARCVEETIPRHRRAVFPFKEGRILVASPLSRCPKQTFGLRLSSINRQRGPAVLFDYLSRNTALRLTERYGISWAAYSGLMLAVRTTLPHFSVSSAMSSAISTMRPSAMATSKLVLGPPALTQKEIEGWRAPRLGCLAPLRTRRRVLPIHRARFWHQRPILA